MSKQAFTNAYIECALWSSGDMGEDGNGPESYSGYDLSQETQELMTKEAEEFYNANHSLWDGLIGYGDEQAGHDFWLTRCGHGAGFWDRPILEPDQVGDRLTKAAEVWGNVDLYLGDDGLVYQA